MNDSSAIAGRLRDAEPEELAERISIEAERLAERDAGPTNLVEALLSLDRADLTPMAAERYTHAAGERLLETNALELAERSPILTIGDTLHAFPVGRLGEDGLARFVDRVLASALRQPPRKVAIHVEGLVPHEGAGKALDALERDLNEQGIGVG
jgi:hypothetical protein